MKKLPLILLSIFFIGCAGNRPIGEKKFKPFSECQIKVINLVTSQFPLISAKVLVKDRAQHPVINLAPPYGHLTDWQSIWEPIIERHPILGADSLLDFKVIEIQPPISHAEKVPSKQLSAQPTFVVLVIDVSGSMAGKPLEKAREAALKFIENADVEIALFAFDDRTYFKNDFTPDKNALIGSITSLTSGGGTHLYNALYDAIQLLKTKIGNRQIIALTDGATGGDNYTLEQIINFANSGDVNINAESGTGAKIFSVGLSYQGQTLKNLAEQTGGEYWFVENPDDLPNVFDRLSEGLLAKFYYLVSYRTPFPLEDGTNRDFNISVSDSMIKYTYKAPLSRTRFHLSGYILDADMGEKVPHARITIRPQDCDSTVTALSDSNGHFQLIGKKSADKYSIFVESPEHFIAIVDTLLCQPDQYYIQKNFHLEKIKVGATVAMRTIYFETNEFLFEPISFPDLMVMGSYLLNHPNLKFEVSGHTDSYGNADYNQWLSEKRAEAVADFFIGLGIPEANVAVNGYGESKMLAPDTSPENRYLNRRVEIKVIEVAHEQR